MRVISTILVILATGNASLPPGWCCALPDSPATCCQDEPAQDEGRLPCCFEGTKLTAKQAEQATVDQDLSALPLIFGTEERGPVILMLASGARPPINYQRVLCRWRC